MSTLPAVATTSQTTYAIKLRDQAREWDSVATQDHTYARVTADRLAQIATDLARRVSNGGYGLRSLRRDKPHLAVHIADDTTDRDEITSRLTARRSEILALTDEQIANLSKSTASLVIDDLRTLA